MISLYEMLEEIDNSFDGIAFDKIEGYSIVGEVRSGAFDHPIQYIAKATIRPGEDDPFEGVGWTPSEAVRNLLNQLKGTE